MYLVITICVPVVAVVPVVVVVVAVVVGQMLTRPKFSVLFQGGKEEETKWKKIKQFLGKEELL